MIRQSVTSVEKLSAVGQSWPVGHYLVGAADDKHIHHCFVLIVVGLDKSLLAIDGYSQDDNPPRGRESLHHLQWIAFVKFARRFCRVSDIFKPPSKRVKRNRRNKEKCDPFA